MSEQGPQPPVTWRDMLDRMMELGLGAALLTKEAAAKAVDEMVKRGSVTADDGKRMLNDMVEKGRVQKERIDEMIAEGVERFMSQADVARRSQIETLERRIAVLEAEVRARTEGSAGPPTPV
jgi:polyhydroxyalkanoate synthesis regulator phasin